MRKAVYPGTFDPVTYGHLDVIKRGSKIFDELVVAVGHNPLKEPLFTINERMDIISKNTKNISNIKVDSFEGMLTDYMKEMQTNVILRGIRTVSDFEYEFQLANMNRALLPEMESLFLTPSEHLSYISSSLVREIASLGGDVSKFVHPLVKDALIARYKKNTDKQK